MLINEQEVSNKISYIFSDFFDTVVSRRCHPEEIKMKWCTAIIDFYNIKNITTKELYTLRLKVEEELCTNNMLVFGESEFSYNTFLKLILSILSAKYGLCQSEDEFMKTALDIELSLEKEYQYINNDVISFLEKNKKLGKKIIIVSDFYLGIKFINELIEYHGLCSLIDKVYVSSEFMKTKRSGRLYSFILEKENVSANNVLMIGDNRHSDVDSAIRKNLYAYHIDRDFSFYHKSISENNDDLAWNKDISTILNIRSPFNWFVIPLFIFIKKLYTESLRKNINHISFLAREGEFLKEAFDLYTSYNKIKTKSHYVYASRKGTYLASLNENLEKIDEDFFDKLLTQYPTISLRTLLKNIHLDGEIKKYKFSNPEINFDCVHKVLKNSYDYKCLINDINFRKDLVSKIKEQKKIAKEYYSQFIDKDTLYVVDVGWKGSIQDNISNIINKKVTGYYCGVLSNSSIDDQNMKFGLLYRQLPNETLGHDIFNEFRALFEVLCAASHGSLVKFNSLGEAVLEHDEQEYDLFINHIRIIQKEVLISFRKLIDLEKKYSRSISEWESVLIPIFRKKVLLPKKYEMELFNSWEHNENFGLLNKTVFKMSTPSRIAMLKTLIKEPRRTVQSFWWKPLGFYNSKLGILNYVYYLYKKFKSI